MKRIKTAIAMSDLHLGRKEIGYLHSKDPKFAKNRDALLNLLQDLGPQDELILNGDFLELSLASLNDVYQDAREFFAILAESGPFERLVFIPGNHDHHFWFSICEQVFVIDKINKGLDPPGCDEYSFCFVDKRFSSNNAEMRNLIVLNKLWPENKPAPEMIVKYPHHLIQIEMENGQKHNLLFTHGHFLENLFKPVNYIIDPAHLEELEAFNSVWLEAFDYHLGHAGRLSEKAKQIVKVCRKGDKEGKKIIKKIFNEIYENMKAKLKLRWPKTWLVKLGFKLVIKKVPTEMKSGLYGISLNEELKKNIEEYLKKYVIKRYKLGKAKEFGFPSNADIPTPFTFIFGHTHQPIVEEGVKIEINENYYPIANTGGWFRTDGTGTGNGENAGVLLVNQSGLEWKSLQGMLE